MTSMPRRSGVLIPLFSAPSTSSWGIGDIADIARISRWLAGAGQRILQLLPLNEMASGHQSPYSAMSAMAIDPIYIDVSSVAEFIANSGLTSLPEDDRGRLEAARRSPRIEYGEVRRVKHHALCDAFERFTDCEWNAGTLRAMEFQQYVAEESWWLEDYALFRAIHERERGRTWLEWPDDLRRREPQALARARQELAREIRFYQYLQWLAGTQWKAARTAAQACGVSLFGDLPFMVDQHSADVWTHQEQFEIERSVGVPPDAFSATGQDWGMPPYDWDAIAANGFSWLRNRARRNAALYDGYRVDHLVGFYRTYSRPRVGKGEPSFSPASQLDQLQLGEQVLKIFREPGSEIIAEDLGTVPDFVRASLTLLGVPGFRVFRWERDWDEEGKPFRDPAEYPPVSVATTGTHDTEPLAVWWEAADQDERAAIAAIPSVQELVGGADLPGAAFIPVVRDVLLEAMFASASNIVLFPIQDLFGWRDRINEPATVGENNWSWRLPWPVDRLDGQLEAQERQRTLKNWAEKYGRSDDTTTQST
jgi:4-alpha-glucanotransferase